MWARVDDDGRVAVGIDDLARTVIGDLSTVDLPTVGDHVTAGRPAVVVRQGEAAAAAGRPVERHGHRSERRARPRLQPPAVAPYKEGWMYRLEPEQGATREMASLRIGKDAAAWMGGEIDRLRRLFEDGRLIAPVEGALPRPTRRPGLPSNAVFSSPPGKRGEVSA